MTQLQQAVEAAATLSGKAGRDGLEQLLKANPQLAQGLLEALDKNIGAFYQLPAQDLNAKQTPKPF